MNRSIKQASFVLVFFFLGCSRIANWIGNDLDVSRVKNPKPIPSFVVPEKQAGVRYLHFLAAGDVGTGGAGQREVAASMAAVATAEPASFVLMPGDNFYETGVTSVTDPQWKTTFEEMYSGPELQIPFYAVLGNHDYRSSPQAQVEYSLQSSRWRMPSRYYTFTAAVDESTTVAFFCLDTNPLAYLSTLEASTLSGESEGGRELAWLDSALATTPARWKIAMGHHTIYSNGEHGNNPVLGSLLEPILVRRNVDVYLAGHDHHQELLNPVNGVNYIISGAGGKHRDVTWRDNTVYAGTNLGFTFFRLSRNELVVEFFDRREVLQFAHTLSKD